MQYDNSTNNNAPNSNALPNAPLDDTQLNKSTDENTEVTLIRTGYNRESFRSTFDTEFKEYTLQVIKNAKVMAQCFIDKGYKVISGGTENHCMLLDLRSKGITGKDAENTLVKA